MTWPEWLKQILCHLYQAWGGVCANMGETPHDWVVTVTGTYQTQGVPPLPDQDAKNRFLLELATLEDCLASPDNSLNETDNLALQQFISDLEKELGVL